MKTKEPWEMTAGEWRAFEESRLRKEYPDEDEELIQAQIESNAAEYRTKVLEASHAGCRIPDAVLDADQSIRARVLHDYPDKYNDYLPPEIRTRKPEIFFVNTAIKQLYEQTQAEAVKNDRQGMSRRRSAKEVADIRIRHRVAVVAALAAGKSVPLKVLADYPDLQPAS
jgi:hypothetical protein